MDIGQVLTFSAKKGKVQCEGNSKEDIKKRRKRKLQDRMNKKNYKK